MPRRPLYDPEKFRGLPCSARLVWFHIWALGEGEYSARELAQDLEMSPDAAARALRLLTERGLLEVVRPPAGSRAGVYRVARKVSNTPPISSPGPA
ncbi:helix-turn-helix domain-containing protein [Thermus amyloliquefaciens]|uniref:helix-turn-helix domain-containing protein n=1 Tax=Thermus amyloliquefaciens TaxID=1449080 RepID=UPI000AE6D1D4|nr:helix-turn-helix domain-containing protein [Thermus amyloliquefaciens]